ncbi:MAG TPA: isochorismate synthase [Acidimicrobiales bacterium]|nr:isochorismate synthase [Acidimicrobiales bacterium]
MTAPLVARTVRLEASPDLVAVAGDDGFLWERDGAGLAGRGVALRVSADAALDVLAAMAVEDEVDRPGTGPVALGALPFDPRLTGAGELVVPSVLVGRSADGAAWLTTVGEATAVGPADLAPPLDRPSPDGFTLTSCRPHEDWCAAVADAVARVRAGDMDKVVLAREVRVEANRPIVVSAVLGRLRALYPSCMVFSFDGFLGASPELLVSRSGREVRSHPLAGTIPRSGDPAVDDRLGAELLASAKDRHEHRVVVDEVAAALGPVCDSLVVPEAPSLVHLRNVCHLGTLVQGTLRDHAASALDLVRRLHPTPAVAGVPTEEALAYLAAVEGFDRGRYAGPVGWMDSRGDGEFAVGIRSAEVDGVHARLLAGVGIVADSVPELELAETQLKLQALLAAVVRP